ncbi:MAG: TnsD family Tn7-like transposition protein [Bacillota bacterium]
MLAFFPHPYRDELLYSVFARYHIRSGNTGPKMTTQELFNSASVVAVVDLPSNLGTLIKNMPVGASYTTDVLIHYHTLYPYYAAFLSPEIAQKVHASMIGFNGGNIHTRAGIMAGAISIPSNLRFCPECAREDFEKFGELYWHRVHQLPGVLVCPEHAVPLLSSAVPVHGFNRHEFVPALLKNCLATVVSNIYTSIQMEHLVALAKDAQWLMEQNYKHLKLDWFQMCYLVLLNKRGLITPKGNVRQEPLANEFVSYYGLELLNFLQSGVTKANEWDWIKEITRTPRKAIHPIRHLLMMRFLAGGARAFLTDIYNRLNDELRLDKQEIRKESSEVQGIVSVNYRNSWLRLLDKDPSLGKTEMRKKEPGVYAWLYRHDRQWLDDNSPASKKKVAISVRVDWEARDFAILEKVKKAVKSLLNSVDKPQRITISRIGKMISSLAILEKHLDRLPETLCYLKSVVESVVDFQIRRVRWAVRVLVQNHKGIKEWKIVRLAGLGKVYADVVAVEIRNWVLYYSGFIDSEEERECPSLG